MSKHNKEINKEPMNLEYFDDVLDIFYDNIDLNESLYKEIHDSYSNNKPSGFSLGTSRSGVEITKTLAAVRATAVQGASALFNAKKSIVELELKKKSQIIDEKKADNDKEFIRTALSEINNPKMISRRYFNEKIDNITSDAIKSAADTNMDKLMLERVIENKVNEGTISFTKNEKAMKYDFNNEVEIVFDIEAKKPVAVKSGTNKVVTDYPIERANVDNILREDLTEGKVYCENGKTLRMVKTSS